MLPVQQVVLICICRLCHTFRENKTKTKKAAHWKPGDEETSLSILYTQTKSVAFGLLRGRRWGKHTKAVQLFCSGTTTESKKSIKGFSSERNRAPSEEKCNLCVWIPERGLLVLSPETGDGKDACQCQHYNHWAEPLWPRYIIVNRNCTSHFF